MLTHVQSSAVLGIDAYTVHVEVDIGNRLPMLAVVRLQDAAVDESRERVRSAIKNSGLAETIVYSSTTNTHWKV